MTEPIALPPQHGMTTQPKAPTQAELEAAVQLAHYSVSMGVTYEDAGRFRKVVGLDLAKDPEPVYGWEDVQTGAIRMATETPFTAESILGLMGSLRARRWEPLHWSPVVYLGQADRELNWRLNQRMQGKDPGQPVNWPGLELALERQQRRNRP